MKKTSVSGMTLLELSLTLFFLSFLFGASAISLSTLLKTRVPHLARAIDEELNFQALRARLEQKEIRLIFKEEGLSDEKGRVLLSFPKSLALLEANFGNLAENRSIIVLRSTGTASPGRVVLSDDKEACSLTQSLYGTRRISCL